MQKVKSPRVNLDKYLEGDKKRYLTYEDAARIYCQNGGNMLELVRYQRKEQKKAAGAEEVIYSATKMIRMENANRKRLGVYAEMPVHSILYLQIKKIAALKNHIWGL